MIHILLVDDEQYVVDDLVLAFPWEELGSIRVYKAYSAYQALDIITSTPIDILITDIAMPGMNGLELVKWVRQKKQKIRCFLLTGYAEFEYAREALHQGVVEYIVKPLDHNLLKIALEKVIHAIQTEIKKNASYEKALLTFKEHLPALKDKLLHELIQGKVYSPEALKDKLINYQLNFRQNDTIYLTLIRLEEHFTSFGHDSQLLFEYAVSNITCEMLADFEVWHCRDNYENLVFLVKSRDNLLQQDYENLAIQLGNITQQLHHNVNDYLKGGISVILSYGGEFSKDLNMMYEDALAALRQQIGNEKGYFLSLTNKGKTNKIEPLKLIYSPPTLMHLLESGQWTAYKKRLQDLNEVLSHLPTYNEEYIEEVHSIILSSFHYIAHTNHALLSELVGRELLEKTIFRSFSQLIEWSETLVDTLASKLERETKTNQQMAITEIQNCIVENLAQASLQYVADYVSLHPAYVTKLFKQCTGISVSEFILNKKLEQAVSWLRDSELKVYEISAQLGYSNSQYFIKVFKEKFGITPQEYRVKV
jgi:two-component system response regulator YesN